MQRSGTDAQIFRAKATRRSQRLSAGSSLFVDARATDSDRQRATRIGAAWRLRSRQEPQPTASRATPSLVTCSYSVRLDGCQLCCVSAPRLSGLQRATAEEYRKGACKEPARYQPPGAGSNPRSQFEDISRLPIPYKVGCLPRLLNLRSPTFRVHVSPSHYLPGEASCATP